MAEHVRPPPQDIADYVRSMSRELIALAREAGMEHTAAALEDAARSASIEARLLQLAPGKAAPGDAA
ncbi:MAG: hypothetical protein AB7P07_03070 [Hyphomonadaceae bacterium]